MLSNPAVLALASLLLVALVAAIVFVAVLAIALRSTPSKANATPIVIHYRMPSQLSPLRMQPLPKPIKQPPKKRPPAKEKAIIRPMRFDEQPMQKFHFK